MRCTALAMAMVLTAATVHPAAAGKCYVDSDCPTGMVCNSEGGCVVPAGSTGGGGGAASGTKLVVYSLILGVIIVALLVPAMRASEEASGARADLDDRWLRRDRPEPVPATCGLTLRF